jgi:hypothetical protein
VGIAAVFTIIAGVVWAYASQLEKWAPVNLLANVVKRLITSTKVVGDAPPMAVYVTDFETNISGDHAAVARDIANAIEVALVHRRGAFTVLDRHNIVDRLHDHKIEDVLKSITSSLPPGGKLNIRPATGFFAGKLYAGSWGVTLTVSLLKLSTSENVWQSQRVHALSDWLNEDIQQTVADELAADAEAVLKEQATSLKAKVGGTLPMTVYVRAFDTNIRGDDVSVASEMSDNVETAWVHQKAAFVVVERKHVNGLIAANNLENDLQGLAKGEKRLGEAALRSADGVVTGELRNDGRGITLTVSLFNIATGERVWQGQRTRPLSDWLSSNTRHKAADDFALNAASVLLAHRLR